MSRVLHHVLHGLSRFRDVVPGLIMVGRNRVGYGVGPEFDPAFRTLFPDTLPLIVGEAATPEVEKAWADPPRHP